MMITTSPLRRLGVSFGLLLALWQLAVAAPLEKPDPGIELNVMTFNIRYGTARDKANHWTLRQDLVLDVIRTQDPDLIGVQEALRFQLDALRKAFPGYGELGLGRDGGRRGEYSAILYRKERFRVEESGTFWLSDTPDQPSSHWGNACRRICTWGRFVEVDSGQGFYLYNTHLDHRSQPSREKGVKLIARQIGQRKAQDPCLLTGDFNAGEDNPVIRYLKEQAPLPMRDTFRVLQPDAEKVGTFNHFQGRSEGAKIDYVFATKEFEVLEAAIDHMQVEGRCPSDHFPVTTRLKLPPPKSLTP